MDDLDAFLTTLYVIVDDFLKTCPPPRRTPGPPPALSRSEAVCLALLGQWARFRSERDFYRFAERRLRPYFPGLPARTQFNRQARHLDQDLTALALWLATELGPGGAYEAVDTTAAPTRNLKRRGHGWLVGVASVGLSKRLGWYTGFHVIAAATPTGVVTGWAFAAANTCDVTLLEQFVAARLSQPAQLPSVGQAAACYLGDRGFDGRHYHARLLELYGVTVIAPPRRQGTSTEAADQPQLWTKEQYRQQAGWRQIIETVFGKLHQAFRLDTERPHELSGFRSRLAAKVAMHNAAVYLNRAMGRPALAFADLLPW